MVIELVRKDFIYLFKSLKPTLFTCIIFSFCLSMVNMGIAVVIPSLVCYIGFYSSLAYEERSKANLLNVSLPVRRQEICLAKYVQVLLFILGSVVLALCGMMIKENIAPSEVALSGSQMMNLIPVMISLALVYSGIMLPCIFRFGTVKSRYVILIIYGAIFGIAYSAGEDMFKEIGSQLSQVSQGNMALLTLAAGIIVFIISYMVSLMIWSKKDF